MSAPVPCVDGVPDWIVIPGTVRYGTWYYRLAVARKYFYPRATVRVPFVVGHIEKGKTEKSKTLNHLFLDFSSAFNTKINHPRVTLG